MTEEKKIERLKDNLRNYTLCYDWWGQFGVDYVKKMFTDNKEEWIKILQEEWNSKPWWLYKSENLSFFAKFICIISRYIPRFGKIGTGKDYLYDLNEQLINIKNNIESSSLVEDHMQYFKLKYLDYRFLIADYDFIHNYEYITCYIFNKVEQYNKLKLSTND